MAGRQTNNINKLVNYLVKAQLLSRMENREIENVLYYLFTKGIHFNHRLSLKKNIKRSSVGVPKIMLFLNLSRASEVLLLAILG